ncbi:hypothetical protein CLOM_g20280 [Closterium sp. NIES-68]|nr:hypothetical protein CLOM_g20280 [Closterium sp. NIES-68]GJP64373.1 hypothetical protein CLOP_g21375 [Closterium sp. NIES-67]
MSVPPFEPPSDAEDTRLPTSDPAVSTTVEINSDEEDDSEDEAIAKARRAEHGKEKMVEVSIDLNDEARSATDSDDSSDDESIPPDEGPFYGRRGGGSHHRSHSRQLTICWAPPPPEHRHRRKRAEINIGGAQPYDDKIPMAEQNIASRFNEQWKQLFPWLDLKYCSKAKKYGFKCKTCIQWVEDGGHTRYGRKGIGARDFQLSSIRTHQHSKAHLLALAKSRIGEGVDKRQRTMREYGDADAITRRTIRCIRAAYFVCCNDCPLTFYRVLTRFMRDEGVPDMSEAEVTERYLSEYAMGEFVQAIAKHLREKLLEEILKSRFYNLAVDESTDRAHGKHMIVYITYERRLHVVTEFLALIPVKKCDAASLFAALTAYLEERSIPLSRLVGISTDGASNMVGNTNGLVTRLRHRVPWLVAMHCIAHREALAAKDAASKFPDFGVIDSIVSKIANNQHRSGVQRNEFMGFHEEMLHTNLELQGMHLVRWLSPGKAITRFCEVFPVLLWMWKKDDLAQFKIATSLKFQFVLYLLADVLELLNELNLEFQKRKVDPTAVKDAMEKLGILLLQWYVEPRRSLVTTRASGRPHSSRRMLRTASSTFRGLMLMAT